MSEFAFVSALTLVFVVAAAFLLVASHYSLPAIPFYLVSGIFVGAVLEETLLLDLAQWGIAFLVFAFAVELEPLEGGGLEVDSAVVAAVQLAVTGAVTFGVGRLLGYGDVNALFFAIAATLSSSVVALSLLEERVRLQNLHERLAESIHFVEDVAAVLLVLGLSAFLYADGGASVAAAGLGLILGGVAFRYLLFDSVTDFAGGDVEILMLTGISLIVGFVALAEFAGVSIVVGAFAAGLAVSSTYPHDVEAVDAIGYVEDFFAPIFFVTLGALVTAPTLETVGASAALVVAVVVLNPALTYAVLRWRSYDSRTALLTGFSLDQVSEFALIVAIEGLVAGVLAPELFDAIVFAAIVTMFVSTLTHRHGDRYYRRLVQVGLLDPGREAVVGRSRVPADLTDHVIVTGYDREGQQVVEACESIGHPYLVIESDPTRFGVVRERCERYVLGDPMSEITWDVARADEAALIVATFPREEWALRVLKLDADVDTVVRAVDVETGTELLERGALFVAVTDVLAAEALREQIEAVLAGEISREELRERGRRRLEQAVEYGPSDVRSPR